MGRCWVGVFWVCIAWVVSPVGGGGVKVVFKVKSLILIIIHQSIAKNH